MLILLAIAGYCIREFIVHAGHTCVILILLAASN